MNTSPHDFVTVDMRGLKAALVAHAKVKRASVSVIVRDAVARELVAAGAECAAQVGSSEVHHEAAGWVKLSIRLTAEEARLLVDGARAAGISRGAYLAGLIAQVPVLTTGASRPDFIATLIASSAELSTLSRNIHRLTALLRQGDIEPARQYRRMLDTLTTDVRSHLKLAAAALAQLQSKGRRVVSSEASKQ